MGKFIYNVSKLIFYLRVVEITLLYHKTEDEVERQRFLMYLYKYNSYHEDPYNHLIRLNVPRLFNTVESKIDRIVYLKIPE